MEDKLEKLIIHIANVHENCLILARELYSSGEEDTARFLIANGFEHDNSKFDGIEWEYLNSECIEKDINNFKIAANLHTKNNLHHPEAWGHGIAEMHDEYLAEMACDWCARSKEFGNNIYKWIDNVAFSRFGFDEHKDIYVKVMKYIDIITRNTS